MINLFIPIIIVFQILLIIVNGYFLIQNWCRPHNNFWTIRDILNGTYRTKIAGSMIIDVNKTVWMKSTIAQLPIFALSVICLIIGYFSKTYENLCAIQQIIFGLWIIINLGLELYRESTWSILHKIIKEKEYPNSKVVKIIDMFKESDNLHILIKHKIPDKKAYAHKFKTYKLTNRSYIKSVINYYNPAKMIFDKIRKNN